MWDIDCLQGDPDIIFGGVYVKTLHTSPSKHKQNDSVLW